MVPIESPLMFASFRGTLSMVEFVFRDIELVLQKRLFSSEEKGGYLCIRDVAAGRVLLLCPVGSMPYNKACECRRNALEKGGRLCRDVRKNPKAVSSWQTRNPAQKKWGGAVRSTTLIFSFSGFPEPVDEALMLSAAMWGDYMPMKVAEVIAGISGNTLWASLKGVQYARR